MLKKTLLAGAAATMLIGAPVVSMTAFAQPSPTATMPSSDSIKIDKLIGRNVVNAQNEKIGDINSVYVGKNGKVDSIIVGVGGFLGMGEREVAVKWSDLTVSNGGEKIMVNATKDQLKAMPEYKYSDKSYRGAVFGDSGVTHPPMAADRAGMDRSNQKTTQTNTLPSTVAPKGGADRTGMDRTTQKTSPTGDTSTTTVPNTRADRTGMDRNTQGVNRNPAMMVHGEMSGNAIIGADVKNAKSETIGTVQDISFAKDGTIKGVIVSVGGFLGIGERNVMVSWSKVKVHEEANHTLFLMTDATKDSLKSMPEFKQSSL